MSAMKSASPRPLAALQWRAVGRRIFGDLGSVGYFVRIGLLLIFLCYFGLPLLWMLLAPSKDQFAIIDLGPLAFGVGGIRK